MRRRTEAAEGGCQLTVLLLYEVVADELVAAILPINTLRNAAVLAARTRLLAMVDVDLMLSASASREMADPRRWVCGWVAGWAQQRRRWVAGWARRRRRSQLKARGTGAGGVGVGGEGLRGAAEASGSRRVAGMGRRGGGGVGWGG